MVTIEYGINGATRVDNSLRRLATGYRKETDKIVGDWTKATRLVLKTTKYPQQSRKPMRFKTAKQRKFFFWALSAGVITVPYKRTGTLANSWGARKNSWSNWSIQNSAPYAHWVVGAAQSSYHSGNWWLSNTIVQSEAPKLTTSLKDKLGELAK